MCIVFFEYTDKHIYVAANREESAKRPSTLPTYYQNAFMHGIIAGEDRGPKGDSNHVGTWLGMNKAGLVVAATNRDDGVLHGKDKTKSRGLLCAELIGCETPNEALEFCVHELQDGGYGGSNYVIINPEVCYVVHGRGPEEVNIQQLHPSMLHVLTNHDVNDPNDVRIKYILENHDDFVADAKKLCSDPKIIINDDDWGTVSSSMMMIGVRLVPRSS